jgi:hypothetical protein
MAVQVYAVGSEPMEFQTGSIQRQIVSGVAIQRRLQEMSIGGPVATNLN